MKTLTLRDAVTVDGKPCRTFTLREPTGADLRGIGLIQLLQGSAPAHAKLLPRIATPHLTAEQVELLPLCDHAAIMAALAGFFGDGSALSEGEQADPDALAATLS